MKKMNSLKASRHDIKNLPNIETVVMNEMQADFRMRKSTDFNSTEMDISSGGIGYPMYKNKKSSTSLVRKKLSRKKPVMVAKKPPRGLEFTSVGFSLLYSENSSDPSEEVQIKRINFETPCKIIMAVLLLYHFLFECNWPDIKETPLCYLQTSWLNLLTNVWPLYTKNIAQQVPIAVNSTNECVSQTGIMQEITNKIDVWMKSLISVLGRTESDTSPVLVHEEQDENFTTSVIDKANQIISNLIKS